MAYSEGQKNYSITLHGDTMVWPV